VQIGEFRAEGGQSVIRGIHPIGCPYRWPCGEPPITLVFEGVPWPTEVILPWQPKARYTFRSGGGDTAEQSSSDTELLQRAKERLSIDFLWQHFGFPERRSNPTNSPFRKDEDPSFSVYDDGRHFKDHGTGDQGDSFDFYQRGMHQNAGQAFIGFVELAGLGDELRRNRGAGAKIHGESLRQDEESKQYEPEEREKLFPYPVIDPKAFHGPFGRIVKAIAPLTEADPVAVLVQLLVGWGNLLGRSAYFSISNTKHFANLFCCIVGRTSKARKGLALGVAQWVLDRIDSQWVKANVRSGLSSGEGLIWKVRDPIIKTQPIKEKGRYTGEMETYVEDEGVKDKRLLVAETEFASALSVMGRSGNTLSAVIRDAFDSKEQLGSLVKNSPGVATGAHISIIEQITRHELHTRMKECEQWDGFANRFMWVCTRRSQVMSNPPDLSEAGLNDELSELVETTQWAKGVEEMERDETAAQLWDAVYRQFAEDDTEDVVSATTDRGDVIMLRLQMIYALSSGLRIIKREHVEAASALWKYAEDSARYLFGARLGNPKAEKIFEALRHAPKGMTRRAISDLVFKRHLKAEVLEEALTLLKKAGWVESQIEQTGGRDAERFFARI
jgi:hypothetical protein